MTNANLLQQPNNSNPSSPAIPEKSQKYTPTKTDGIFAIFCYILSYLYVVWVFPFEPALSTALFILFFIIFGIFYGKTCGFRQTKTAIPYLILLLLAAIRFIIFDNDFPAALLFLFVSLMAVYWVCVFSRKRICLQQAEQKDNISSLLIWDLCNQLFLVAFVHFGSGFESLRSLFGKRNNSKTLVQVLIGILICIPVSFVVIQLLCSADIVFHNLLDLLFAKIFSNIYISILKFFLAIPIWCYLFGLFYGNFRNRTFHGISNRQIETIRTGMRKMPKATAYTILTMLNLIYILFFVSQSAYLFSGFSNLLPMGFTYAQYAREGFFQLCAIAFINFMITWLSFIIIEKKDKNPKTLTIEIMLLSCFTLLFIATALSKMVMYINFYGLTRLRIYTAWFMIVLFLLFLLIMAKSIFKFHISKAAFLIFCVSFFVLCFSNIDGMIAKYNITRFEKGTLSTFDAADYKNLSAGAVPYLYEFYQNISEDGAYIGTVAFETGNTDKGILALSPEERIQLKSDLKMILERRDRSHTWYDGDFKTFHLQDYAAQKLVFDSKK